MTISGVPKSDIELKMGTVACKEEQKKILQRSKEKTDAFLAKEVGEILIILFCRKQRQAGQKRITLPGPKFKVVLVFYYVSCEYGRFNPKFTVSKST